MFYLLPILQGQPVLRPLRSQDCCRAGRDRQLAAQAAGQAAPLELRSVHSVLSQRQANGVEPQAGLPDMPGAGFESTHQATQAAGARQA